MERIIKTGNGWRLGWQPNASQYNGLVAGENWAIELTEAELNDFCRLAKQLSDTMQQMTTELMEEEKISCEAESEQLWMEVEGYPSAYSLHFILYSGRGAEGKWPPAAVSEMITAIETLKVF
ncbi:DUF1818 family protein [Ancylothrix sp. C2]|uniref:DUF1818 family protein n=1 Tax=Ancylothrix sp. D3o TaxID=2953691 RepID=UPI0021BAD952|nr:DUF1818 family protein [Ancylothrix sp. D3o]MCT7948359.1 DUF1818 family protein [Ancylothrix sp. D3o]